MQTWTVNNDIELRIVNPNDADSLYRQIEKTRKQLVQFMPWGDTTRSVDDEREFLSYCQGRISDGKLFALSIWINKQPVGMVDLHNIDSENSHAEVGYWLGGEYQNKGVMTACVRKLIELGFSELNLHKIKLLAEEVNKGSNIVAQKVGFELEGKLLDEIYSNGKFHDANLYGLIM